jgi:RimJ/RimL family protein N-acetyltransferase
MLRVSVRRARASDREAVFKFCKKTWSWGDYIPWVWDKWLKEKDGRVFVATVNDVPVGISHLSIDKPTEVWLSGARTDPKYRRMGVATAITKKCLEYAKRGGAKVARLMTESDNVAAQAVAQKLGFVPVTEFVDMTEEKMARQTSKGSRFAEKTETAPIWHYLQTSEAYRKSAGLYTTLFHWYSLQKPDLKRFIHQQKAIAHLNENGEVNGLILVDDATAREWSENSMQTCLITGEHSTVFDMCRFLKSYCHCSDIKKLYFFACNHKPVIAALEKLGLEKPKMTEIVYEKRIHH